MDEISFGKRLKDVRNARGLTLKALADLCNHGNTHLTAIENGKRKINIETLVDLVNVLHVSTDYLLQDSLQQEHNDRAEKLLAIFGAMPDEQLDILLENVKAGKNNNKFYNLITMLSSLSKKEQDALSVVADVIRK